MTTDNFCFCLQNRLIPKGQTGGQRYSDTSPFTIPWFIAKRHIGKAYQAQKKKHSIDIHNTLFSSQFTNVPNKLVCLSQESSFNVV
jgi:hypothetical protein